MKKIVNKIIAITLVMMALFNAASNNKVKAAILTPEVSHSWSFTLGTPSTSNEDWKLIYSGAAATKKGEVDTLSYEVSYQHTYSGSIETTIKKDIQVQLGYSFGKSESFTISRSTAPLEKGEYVKGYYAKAYSVTPIKQKDTQHITGWKQKSTGGEYEYVDYYNTVYSTAYGKKAIFPQFRFEYYKKKSVTGYSKDNLIEGANGNQEHESVSLDPIGIEDCEDDELIRTEIYTYTEDGVEHVSIVYPHSTNLETENLEEKELIE